MMSATSIDPQTSKGQDASKAFPVSVQNGSLHQKDTVHDSDFEPYLTGQSNQNNSYQSMTDPYLSSYYAPSIGFPYPLSEAPWSTGGDPPIPYLTPYAPLSNGDHHFMHDTVFGQPGGLGSSIYPPAHRFNFFPENPAFSAWGAPPPPPPQQQPAGQSQQGQQQQQQQTQSSVSQAYGGSYSYPPSSLGGTLVQPGDAPGGQATTGFHAGVGDALQSKAPGMNHHHHHHHGLEQGMLGLKLGGVGVGDMVGSGLKVGSVIGGGNNVVAASGNGGGGGGMGTPIGMPLQNKPASWAAIASKPAKLTPVSNNNNNGGNNNKSKSNNNNNNKPVIMGVGGGMMPPGGGGGGVVGLPLGGGVGGGGGGALPGGPPIKHNMEIGTWDNKGGSVGGGAKVQAPPTLPPHPHHHPHHQQHHQQHHHHHGLHMAAPPPQQSLVQQMSMQAPPPPHHSQQQQTYQNHSSMHPPPPQTRWVAPRNRNPGYGGGGGLDGSALAGGGVGNGGGGPLGAGPGLDPSHPVLEKLRANHSYNPKEFEWNLKNGRVFIIKSYSEDDIHRSIKYSIWCSTEHGNKRLDQAFRSLAAKGPVYLLFSVNGSGHFCGVAEMRSPVDYGASAGVWAQDKWKGKFDVAWLFVKDVPNSQLRHIRLENNDNKPVTNSRDTQEVPLEKAKLVLKIIAAYKHTTSIFDDFSHYEKKQEEEEVVRKTYEPAPIQSRSRLDQDRQNRSKQ